jgi:predicted dehydrogenase
MVHENFRWQHAMRVVKEALPRIGDLAFGRITWRTGWDIYTNQPYLAREPQLVVADMGVHILDLARFFMGEANQLYCQTQRVNTRVLGEDQATVMLKMQSGATCVAEMSYYSKLDRELFPQTLVHFEGTLGSVTLHPDFEVAVTVDSAVEWIDARAPEHPWSAPMFAAVQDSVVGIQQHWADCLHRGRDPETSGADNLRTLELVYGAYESAQTGLPYRTFNR